MTAITEGQESVLRSFVGQTEGIADLQAVYDRLDNFDDTVLEILRKQLAVMISDEASLIVIDGTTINKSENIRQLRSTIKSFSGGGGTGLETTSNLGTQVVEISRPDLR